MRRIWIAAVVALVLGATASAGPMCGTLLTLADYISTGAAGCDTLNGFNFANFSWTPLAGSLSLSASAINVYQTSSGSNQASLRFGDTATFAASSNNNTVVYLDYFLLYTVTNTLNIVGASGSIQPGTITHPSGAVNVTKNLGSDEDYLNDLGGPILERVHLREFRLD